MAQRVRIELTDDLAKDGTLATQTVTFALDGVNYEIDLSDENAQKLRDDLAQWVAAARRAGGRKVSSRGNSSRRRSEAGSANDIRAWARAQGMEVSDRGRVKDEIRAAYEAAHA
ncbi:MAG: Lsr2 family protein [Propioniciclava sp.]|uniref:histone-like nucleoid-structuring protein Lsr2 n=1 Tax=Propioniciclava sp. TaxID=2038686 RepID=UPI0039E6487E